MLCFKYTCSLSSISRAANVAKITLEDIVFSDEEIVQPINGDDNVDGEDGVDNALLELARSVVPEEEEEEEDATSAEEEFEIQTDESESSDSSSESEIESDDEEVANLNLRYEELLFKMRDHSKQWQTQREYVKMRRDQGKEDFFNKVLWPLRRDILVADYAQNLDLPHFGGEQPGDTYYYSPLTINVFGVVDYSVEVMDAYIYTEAEGKKGGNNVVSLLQNSLKKKGVFRDAEEMGPGEHLTLVFDNCGGQNKNHMVIRYAMYLVEKKIYKCVELVFLVCGHTKNVCDRMFKELKQKFHHKNVYTMGQLMDVLNYSPKVNAVRAPSEMHFDWGTYFDKLYKRPANGTVTKIIFFKQK